jgi:hypothetical protein
MFVIVCVCVIVCVYVYVCVCVCVLALLLKGGWFLPQTGLRLCPHLLLDGQTGGAPKLSESTTVDQKLSGLAINYQKLGESIILIKVLVRYKKSRLPIFVW